MKKVSKNPIINKEYVVPKNLDDSIHIKNFLSKNNNKPVVMVQGLGFVGAVMSIVCANAINTEYAVIGIDLPSEDSYWKIASINDGFFPVVSSDPKVEEYYKKAKEKGKIAGIHNGSVKYMKEMMQYGFQFTTLLSDFRMMTSNAESLLKELKDVDTKSDNTSAY